MPGRGIAFLEEMAEELSASDRELFHRIFHVSTVIGSLKAPPSMHQWIIQHFGSLAAVECQRIIKVTNLVTMEGAIFNPLRAQRPMKSAPDAELERAILEDVGDPFCHPLERTPEDVFGRIRGEHAITASNVAKYNGFHGLVIFDEHDPLIFTAEEVGSYLDTALEWAQEAHRWDSEAKYLFFMWNCLWKSGASIAHGHAQMSLSRGSHYAKVEAWRRAALGYKERYGTNYFRDLERVHAALGLGWRWGPIGGLAYITPTKDKEILLLAKEVNSDLKSSIYRALRCLTQEMEVRSFNLALYMPPLAPTEESWEGFPLVVRIVDRGDPLNRTADMGAMELYASSIITSDPFAVAEALRARPNSGNLVAAGDGEIL